MAGNSQTLHPLHMMQKTMLQSSAKSSGKLMHHLFNNMQNNCLCVYVCVCVCVYVYVYVCVCVYVCELEREREGGEKEKETETGRDRDRKKRRWHTDVEHMSYIP